jgi:hypothetical protein
LPVDVDVVVGVNIYINLTSTSTMLLVWGTAMRLSLAFAATVAGDRGDDRTFTIGITGDVNLNPTLSRKAAPE